jgi:hypothetical protein
MQFSDTDTKQGILQDIEMTVFGNYGDITSNTSRLQQFTAYCNRACDQITSLIMSADSRWQWDDSNNTDLPIGTTALVADQQDYTFDTDHLKITRVELKNEDGDWQLLIPIDQVDIFNTSLTDWLNTAGQPKYYDKIGTSIFLYPKPDYAQAASLKVYFQRAHGYFVTTDSTKTPGFTSIYHRLVAFMASYDYAKAKSLTVEKSIKADMDEMKQSLEDFFAMRSKDEKIQLSSKNRNFNFK